MKNIILFLTVLVPMFMQATIREIDSFQHAKETLDLLDTTALVVFDVDSVLIEHAHPILQPPNAKLLKKLIAKHTKNLSVKQVDDLFSIVYLEAPFILIEPHIVAEIAALQARNIPVIALTATQIGGIGRLPSIQEWRIQQLKEKGIMFTKLDEPILDTLNNFGPSPVFKDGILFSSRYDKGKTLQTLLEAIRLQPSAVVFFDDLIENATSVDTHMNAMGIEKVHCFHYTGAKRVHAHADPKLAEQQFLHLLEHEEWREPVTEN